VTKRSEWLAGALLAGIGVLFALAALEVGVRVLHLVPDRFWESDPLRGVRLVAGRSGWWTQEDREFVVPIHVNGEGLRDVEHALEKPAATRRVLVVGDSFIEALHVPVEETLGRHLEKQLNAKGEQRFEVISAGVSGYGTAAEVLFFESDLRRYEADLVVLAFYPGNDIKNNSPTLEDYLQPQYDADGTLLRIINRQKAPRAPRLKALQLMRQTLVRQPALAQRLVGWGILSPTAVRTAPERNGIPVDFGVYAQPVDAEWLDAWSKTESLLGRFRRAVERERAQLVVMIVSTRDQIYPEAWAQIVKDHPSLQGGGWDLDAPQRRIETWCEQHGVRCLALAPAFREVARAGQGPLHYPRDGHWTPAGHALAATVLTNYLKDAPL